MVKTKINGKERKDLALKLEASGTYNVLNQFKLEYKEIPNTQTFKNILYEARHKQEMLSSNFIVDAIGLYFNDVNEQFIHNIGLNPFGALFASQYQVFEFLIALLHLKI